MTWLQPELKKTIVMISDGTAENFAEPKGSGALIHYKKKYLVISARHVIEKISNPVILFNNKNNKIIGKDCNQLREEYGFEWVYHPNEHVDLAIFPFGIGEEYDIKFVTEKTFLTFDEIREGVDVFFLGFPLGLSQKQTITPVVRQGCVSLKIINTTIINRITYEKKTILIDGNISAGNSGSPLFTKPSFIDMEKLRIDEFKYAKLCGIVTGHIQSIIKGFNDEPIARENSGIGIISSIDHFIDLFEQI